MLNIEVYPTDLYGLYSWNKAVKAVISLGNGWRLPTKDELNQLYANRAAVGGFGAPTTGVRRSTMLTTRGARTSTMATRATATRTSTSGFVLCGI